MSKLVFVSVLILLTGTVLAEPPIYIFTGEGMPQRCRMKNVFAVTIEAKTVTEACQKLAERARQYDANAVMELKSKLNDKGVPQMNGMLVKIRNPEMIPYGGVHYVVVP